MGTSQLFRRWGVLVVSAVSWFYTGSGGGFDYWMDGPENSATTFSPPLWNVGMVGDNEYMYHRIGTIGEPAEYVPEGVVKTSSLLGRTGDGWELQNADGSKNLNFANSQIRISLLWKALVF